MDFTLKTYHKLLTTLQEGGYGFQTFSDFIGKPEKPVVVLRHDVDRLPGNALDMAQLEKKMRISGSYYFRTVPGSWDAEIIKKVHDLGHEVGYHYETMSKAAKMVNGKSCFSFTNNGALGRLKSLKELDKEGRSTFNTDGEKVGEIELTDTAYELFRYELDCIRKIVPVKTAVMHGSPLSRFNNLDIWKKYDYRELGIIGEPYLDVDFSDVFYLTDTGRCWDGGPVSVRDKVKSGFTGPEFVFRTTSDIIDAVRENRLPDRIMINIHPQRWTDKPLPWLKEMVWQNIKNHIKRFIA